MQFAYLLFLIFDLIMGGWGGGAERERTAVIQLFDTNFKINSTVPSPQTLKIFF